MLLVVSEARRLPVLTELVFFILRAIFFFKPRKLRVDRNHSESWMRSFLWLVSVPWRWVLKMVSRENDST